MQHCWWIGRYTGINAGAVGHHKIAIRPAQQAECIRSTEELNGAELVNCM